MVLNSTSYLWNRSTELVFLTRSKFIETDGFLLLLIDLVVKPNFMVLQRDPTQIIIEIIRIFPR